MNQSTARNDQYTQAEMVYAVLYRGARLTLWEIRAAILDRFGKSCAETSISARIREIPKIFGRAYAKSERVVDGKKLRGVWEYYLLEVPAARESASVSAFGPPSRHAT